MIFLHTSYGHLIFGNHKTANFNSFTPIQYKVINFVSLTEIRGGNPVMLSFKWNLFSKTLAWCYLFVRILQKEILILIVSVIFFCHHLGFTETCFEYFNGSRFLLGRGVWMCNKAQKNLENSSTWSASKLKLQDRMGRLSHCFS